jgi:hypothetical protein
MKKDKPMKHVGKLHLDLFAEEDGDDVRLVADINASEENLLHILMAWLSADVATKLIMETAIEHYQEIVGHGVRTDYHGRKKRKN